MNQCRKEGMSIGLADHADSFDRVIVESEVTIE